MEDKMDNDRYIKKSFSTMEKAELLLVLLENDTKLQYALKNPETREAALQRVGLTKPEVDGLIKFINRSMALEEQAVVIW